MRTETANQSFRRWALLLACVATFMLMLDVTVINVTLPMIRREFSADLADQQWIIAAYTLPLAAFLLAGGSLADRYGRRTLFIIGLVLFTAGSLAAGLAPGLVVLEVSRVVQGIGAAVLFAVSPALIAQEFSGVDRAKAFGIFGGVTGLALALGPVVGGLLATVNWRWVFLVNVPIGVILLLVGFGRARDVLSPNARRPHLFGLATSAGGLGALTFGIIESERLGWASTEVLTALVLGALLIALFLISERHPDTGMLDLALFRNRTFSGLLTATFLSNATSLAGLFLIVSYLQNVLGLSALQAGLVLLPLTLVLFVVAAVTGQILPRVAPGALLGTAILLIAAGLTLLALAGTGSGWVRLLPGLIVMGIGMGMFNPPRSVVTVGVVTPEQAGLASGVGETFQQVGVVFGIAVFGALFQHKVIDAAGTGELGKAVASGDLAGVPADVVDSARSWFASGLSWVMIACGILCALGALVAFATIRKSDMLTDEGELAEVSA
ncbi:MFS transporter [Rhodococcus sp. LW-XY12]|uniref:MFS transporter n=1 Tax=Rhodococcus sp. LW-XY12 TaxID=2856851 RepID=UPI001C577F61|nr:MFS transporter [Rhodococcus sp. LW-XY12]QXU52191.1 MFS transporter [Rhodococcus sp. LW-XY12]